MYLTKLKNVNGKKNGTKVLFFYLAKKYVTLHESISNPPCTNLLHI